MVVALLLFFLVIYLNHRGKLIEAWIKAVIIWTMIAFVSLEILSLFSAVTFSALVMLWAGVDLVSAIRLIWLLGKRKAGRGIGRIAVHTIKEDRMPQAVLSPCRVSLLYGAQYVWGSFDDTDRSVCNSLADDFRVLLPRPVCRIIQISV
ncbi:MAG TPA: hypothetical protein H9717_11435 [Candidatus Eisenbergiella merdipullorum]|uniref:Uncharacterized protein n=1 Tax=Candidatus Eisenbergiella merdipullorum TaxID=2838553 RepID=A0A9D2L0S4_9FIRM|nr:hypothetical protein [Candidatus Eisenbergiella merdipullorum]